MHRSTRAAVAAVATAALLATITPSASAEVEDAFWSQGEGRAPTTVYQGSKGPIYVGSLPGWPAGKQFAGLENSTSHPEWMIVEYRGVAGGVATCVPSGKVTWFDSSVVQAWIHQGNRLHCTVGDSERVS